MLDALLVSVQSITAAAQAAANAGPLALTNEQMAQLTHKVGVAAERGMERHANRISGWRAAIVGAVGAGGLLVGAGVTFAIDAWQLETTRIDTRTAIGALSTADAADWAKLIRLKSAAPAMDQQTAGCCRGWLERRLDSAPHGAACKGATDRTQRRPVAETARASGAGCSKRAGVPVLAAGDGRSPSRGACRGDGRRRRS